MTLEVLTDVESLALHAAEIVAGEARAAVKVRGRFTVAISGGRTPWVMLRALNALVPQCLGVSDSEPTPANSGFRGCSADLGVTDMRVGIATDHGGFGLNGRGVNHARRDPHQEESGT